MKKKLINSTLCLMLAGAMLIQSVPASMAYAQSKVENVCINEINSSPDDWVEFYNSGSEKIDISGYEIRDNSEDHRWKFPEETIIEPGEFKVADAKSEGLVYDDSEKIYKSGTFESAIGIGSGDSIRLYDKEGTLIDEYTWTEHASFNGDAAKASYGRYPDGTGNFALTKETKGEANKRQNIPVVINEVQSKDPAGGPDWIELANPTDKEIDISGIIIKDNDDNHSYEIPSGTKIKARGFFVVTDETTGFGLGKGDSVRLFQGGELIGETTWENHTNPTWGLFPDVNGKDYRNTTVATPGEANMFEDAPVEIEGINWPGPSEVKIFDKEAMFLEDSSGLDFHDGKLYGVDNGTAKFWIMDVAKDGQLKFAKGFEDGKRVIFQKDAGNSDAKGPDAEGITVDGNGFVYIASERDNSNKGVNFNSILMVDPMKNGQQLVAEKEWDLTSLLPQVSANMGIESVEWVSKEDISGKIVDKNTGKAFDMATYPEAVSGGIFFTALEDNGHVYAFVLNDDGTAVQIADIDSGLGGAMAMDYDTYEDVLWVMADDGYGNRGAKLTFTGTEEVKTVTVNPPEGVNKKDNNEGFAIAEADYTKDGVRPVYRFKDGVKSGALSIGGIYCSYNPSGEITNPELPEGTGIGGSAANKGDEVLPDAPKTGDMTNIIFWVFVISTVGITLIVELIKDKKRKTTAIK